MRCYRGQCGSERLNSLSWGLDPAHSQLVQPCLRTDLFGLNRVLIFIIIFFNMKDFRFFAGCQSPEHTLLLTPMAHLHDVSNPESI